MKQNVRQESSLKKLVWRTHIELKKQLERNIYIMILRTIYQAPKKMCEKNIRSKNESNGKYFADKNGKDANIVLIT